MASNTLADQPLTLRQLAIFDAVTRCRSVGRAAREMGLSQPAISHALRQMESSLGVRLLDRGSNGSAPTPLGAILHRRVARLREQVSAGIAAVCQAPIGGDAVRQRLAALSSAQVSGHLAIASTGSFRAAARRLGISEPAVHRTARELERLLGTALYVRRQQIGVTAAGETFAASLQRGIAEIKQAQDEIAASLGASAGRIALGCLPFMPKSVLAAALGELIKRNPTVQVSLEEGAYDRLRIDLKNGKLDMLVGALRSGEDVVEFKTEHLFVDPYLIVARSGHPLANRPQPYELVAQGWVVPPIGTPRRAALENFFAMLPERPRVVLETASVTMTVETLMESDCLSLSCRSQVETDFAPACLVTVDIPIMTEQREVGITLRSDWLPTPVQSEFLELLKKTAAVAP